MGKKFEYRMIVTIADTNLFKHVDFSKFFDLQGVVRSLWVKEAVAEGPEEMIHRGYLITKSAHCDFIKDFYIYDEILVTMQTRNIKHVSVEIVFTYLNPITMEIHATGYQKIVFADNQKKICRIPANFREAANEYLAEK